MSADTAGDGDGLVDALRRKVRYLEAELDDRDDRIDELEAESGHLRNRIERIEDELGLGRERFR